MAAPLAVRASTIACGTLGNGAPGPRRLGSPAPTRRSWLAHRTSPATAPYDQLMRISSVGFSLGHVLGGRSRPSGGCLRARSRVLPLVLVLIHPAGTSPSGPPQRYGRGASGPPTAVASARDAGPRATCPVARAPVGLLQMLSVSQHPGRRLHDPLLEGLSFIDP
jgi:hypothetical protein